MGKTYILKRDAGGPYCVVLDGGREYSLPHIRRHSPTGYEWGYGGSGPADLALSILTDLIGFARAVEHYMDFKSDVVSKIPTSGAVLSESQILDWLRSKVRS